jgi:conjugative transfer signal peptidase TraF
MRAGADRAWNTSIAATLAVCVGAAMTIGASKTLRINFTSSLPRGIYRTVPGPPSRGAIVIACLPSPIGRFARSRGYLWRGDCPGGAAPVGKTVAAVAGDTVVARAEGLTVNGYPVRNTRVLPWDTRGRPMRHFPYAVYVLGPGELWLTSSCSPASFDSRYFGPINIGAVRSRISPLWPRQQWNSRDPSHD